MFFKPSASPLSLSTVVSPLDANVTSCTLVGHWLAKQKHISYIVIRLDNFFCTMIDISEMKFKTSCQHQDLSLLTCHSTPFKSLCLMIGPECQDIRLSAMAKMWLKCCFNHHCVKDICFTFNSFECYHLNVI